MQSGNGPKIREIRPKRRGRLHGGKDLWKR